MHERDPNPDVLWSKQLIQSPGDGSPPVSSCTGQKYKPDRGHLSKTAPGGSLFALMSEVAVSSRRL